MHSMSLLRMLRRTLGIHLYPYSPCGIHCKCSTSWRSDSCNVVAGKGYKSCTSRYRISQRWSIGDGCRSRRPVKGVWHDQLSNSSLPYCRYGGIVLLEEKIVSSPIGWQYMWMKAFIHIALACKCAPNYM